MGAGKNTSGTEVPPSNPARFSERVDAALRGWSADGRHISKPLKVTFLSFLVMTVVAFTAQHFASEFNNLRAPLERTASSAKMLLQHQKTTGTSGLELALLGLSTNENMIKAMKSGREDDIQTAAMDSFEEMRVFHDISELSIYDATLKTAIHAHARNHFEDAEKTYLLSLAETMGRATRGLEFGHSGLSSIVAVRPWKVNGELIGYLRLSTDLYRPLSLIGTSLGTDVVEVYPRDHFPDQQSLSDFDGDWQYSGPYVFQLAGGGALPQEFSDFLPESLSSGSLFNRIFVSDGRVKVMGDFPLMLADGSHASSLVLLHDITDNFWTFLRSTAISVATGVLLALLSWSAFNRLIASLQNSVHATRQKLEQEVAANTRELQQNKNRLTDAQKIASVGSWERDLENGELHWSEEMYRIVGLPMGSDSFAARKYLYQLIPEAERATVSGIIEKAERDCSNFDFEHNIVRRDGSIRYLHVRGYAVAGEDGIAARMFGTTHDITEHHIAQEQSLRLASILEASLNEVYIFDGKTLLFEYANGCARDNLGYSMDELSGLTTSDISPQHSDRSFGELIAPLLAGEQSLINVDGVQLRKDGSRYPVEVRLQMHQERNKQLIVAIANDLTERTEREKETQTARAEAERIAYFDSLTQLPNRAGCRREAEKLFSDTCETKPAFIIHLDLDNFKRINDTLGHTAGDHCLQEAGERLKMCCNGLGAAYRWGGDEFVIIAEGPDADPEELCQRVHIVMRAPMEFEGNQFFPSVSMGVARCPDDGDEFATLLVHADLALYRSKENGKDRWSFFTSEMKIDSDEEARTEKELRQAIRRDEFFLVFQPQVNIRTQEVTGIEALVRWQHPTRGTLGPGAFLPVVEKSNLASTLGEIVIDKALAAARVWQDTDIDFGRIAVNLSPSHLTSGTLLKDFNAAMKRHGVGPELITAEVLESVFLDDERSDNAQVLEELHSMGVHIELDDFGTGYASLSHVADLPINGLKIDRSFTAQMLDDAKKEIVVNQLIHLARSLNIDIICEGVETDAQFDRLRMMGNFSVQGYLVARPMPYEAITEWLSSAPEDLLIVV